MTADLPPPRLLPCGDSAISVDFGDRVDPELNARVIALDAALAAEPLPGIVETVPTYRALMVHVDPVTADLPRLMAHLSRLAARPAAARRAPRRWRVPVVYGGAFGLDLDALAERHAMSAAEVVERHAAAVYTVYMIGFLPGFAYLGGLDPRLATPRREVPRPVIPASSVSIGGAQSAVGSVPGPSGWHLIGRTPARPFLPGRKPLFLFEAGDEISFAPMPADEWERLDAAAARGAPVIEALPG
jgi:KipI family sensor histidine kinase inhibitor